jgi:hypothetical protein
MNAPRWLPCRSAHNGIGPHRPQATPGATDSALGKRWITTTRRTHRRRSGWRALRRPANSSRTDRSRGCADDQDQCSCLGRRPSAVRIKILWPADWLADSGLPDGRPHRPTEARAAARSRRLHHCPRASGLRVWHDGESSSTGQWAGQKRGPQSSTLPEPPPGWRPWRIRPGPPVVPRTRSSSRVPLPCPVTSSPAGH